MCLTLTVRGNMILMDVVMALKTLVVLLPPGCGSGGGGTALTRPPMPPRLKLEIILITAEGEATGRALGWCSPAATYLQRGDKNTSDPRVRKPPRPLHFPVTRSSCSLVTSHTEGLATRLPSWVPGKLFKVSTTLAAPHLPAVCFPSVFTHFWRMLLSPEVPLEDGEIGGLQKRVYVARQSSEGMGGVMKWVWWVGNGTAGWLGWGERIFMWITRWLVVEIYEGCFLL